MSLQTGTLIGAVIKTNDSLDQYPVSEQSDIKGGHHSAATVADMDAIGAWLRDGGMTCAVAENGNTYQLASDLVTWNLLIGSGGGTIGPGSGGNSTNTVILSGNFGAWTPLDDLSGEIVSQIELDYKTDLPAFPSRAITYLQGQFSLNAGFAGTAITLGNLPVNSRPFANIIKYLIVANVELYLFINTDGDVSLAAKDEFNLPAGNVAAPYLIDTFFQPVIVSAEPETFTSTRTENFTRNNCGSGYSGSVVSYSQDYTSTVDQATADALAANDPNYEAAGQAYANDPDNGTCTIQQNSPSYSMVAQNNTASSFIEQIHISGAENYGYTTAIPAGGELDKDIGLYTYADVVIGVKILDGTTKYINVNGDQQTIAGDGTATFNNVVAPIFIALEDTDVPPTAPPNFGNGPTED